MKAMKHDKEGKLGVTKLFYRMRKALKYRDNFRRACEVGTRR